ncbi:MAG: acyl-CoA thioesterase [Bacteroidales bacterium]|nr:acyl-CoA thioesterase [Candidatus Cryptobacteroides aphodequi]
MAYVHQVKYYECDRMGITHHSNYVRFMEEARIDWLDRLGYGFERMEAEGIVSPVISISCNYRKMTTFKDEIEIDVKVKDLSPLKLTLAYEMKVRGELVFTGESVHCFMENGKPVKIAERFPFITI